MQDTKPPARIVNRGFKPLDDNPLLEHTCPVCGGPLAQYGPPGRAHVVPKGVGGDDVPENAAWVCGDGVMGCHGCLTHRNTVIGHSLSADDVAEGFVFYCREIVPALGAYSDRRKYDGWLEDYYLGTAA